MTMGHRVLPTLCNVRSVVTVNHKRELIKHEIKIRYHAHAPGIWLAHCWIGLTIYIIILHYT